MIMLVSLLIFMLTGKEVKWVAEAEKINDELDGVTEEEAEKHTLSKEEKRAVAKVVGHCEVGEFLGRFVIPRELSSRRGAFRQSCPCGSLICFLDKSVPRAAAGAFTEPLGALVVALAAYID